MNNSDQSRKKDLHEIKQSIHHDLMDRMNLHILDELEAVMHKCF